MITLINEGMVLTACKKRCEELPPEAITQSASFITQSGATLNGSVITHGVKTYVTYEFGTTTSYGQNTELKEFLESIPYSSSLKGLSPGTNYHYRLKAIGSCQTTYGKDFSFTTFDIGESGIIFNPNLTYGSINDIDGNTYKTIQIGTQTWMAENLKTTKYNDATAIPMGVSNTTEESLTTPYYLWYDNDSSIYKISIGALYNWYTVNTGKLCPTSWHVPDNAEWNTMMTFLGGQSVAGGKLKQTGTILWQSPNTGATNESGFTALPGGYFDGIYSFFFGTGLYGFWWSTTESNDNTGAWYFFISQGSSYFSFANVTFSNGIYNKKMGYSVRCVKD